MSGQPLFSGRNLSTLNQQSHHYRRRILTRVLNSRPVAVARVKYVQARHLQAPSRLAAHFLAC